MSNVKNVLDVKKALKDKEALKGEGQEKVE